MGQPNTSNLMQTSFCQASGLMRMLCASISFFRWWETEVELSKFPGNSWMENNSKHIHTQKENDWSSFVVYNWESKKKNVLVAFKVELYTALCPGVQREDNTRQWINRFLMDKSKQNVLQLTLDRELSSCQPLITELLALVRELPALSILRTTVA